jgi:hypothetical protein
VGQLPAVKVAAASLVKLVCRGRAVRFIPTDRCNQYY